MLYYDISWWEGMSFIVGASLFTAVVKRISYVSFPCNKQDGNYRTLSYYYKVNLTYSWVHLNSSGIDKKQPLDTDTRNFLHKHHAEIKHICQQWLIIRKRRVELRTAWINMCKNKIDLKKNPIQQVPEWWCFSNGSKVLT